VQSLPPELELYRQTGEFSEATIPAALRSEHTTKAGVWARIRVVEGELLLSLLEPALEEVLLTPQRPGIVAPQVPHRVEPRGPVRFRVEFLR
jgi:tellurite resistance-related uncharacterized protein